MNMDMKYRWMKANRSFRTLAVAAWLLGLTGALAQPSIVSTVPANLATGVSTTNEIVFTFSEVMDTNATTVTFISEDPYAMLTNTTVWSVGNTVLTCTPNPAFPPNSTILWVVQGQDLSGNQLTGLPEGSYTTGTSTSTGGGGGGGSGTNKYTSFLVGQDVVFDQDSATTLAPQTNGGYDFFGSIVLASNVTASTASLTLPNGSVTNSSPYAGDFFFFGSASDQAAFDSMFGTGNYIFTLNPGTSNEQTTVTVPTSWTQPTQPQVSNYDAAQSIDPTQPFTLEWNSFTGAAANDYIFAVVYTSADFTTIFSNTLPGTATSVQIPAGTFSSNSTYSGTLAFLHLSGATNTATATTTGAYLESATQFSLITTGGGTGGTGGTLTAPTLANPFWNGHFFSFTVNAGTNENVTVEFNSSLSSNGWQTLFSTNTLTGVIQVTDTLNTTGPAVFYRAEASL
jgi:hypothetical protein